MWRISHDFTKMALILLYIEFSILAILQKNQGAKFDKSKNKHTHCAASLSGPFRSSWTLYLSRHCMWHLGPSTWKPGHQLRHQAIHLSQMCRAPLGLGNRVDTWSQSTELATPCRSFHLWQQLHLFLRICPIKDQQNHIQRHNKVDTGSNVSINKIICFHAVTECS